MKKIIFLAMVLILAFGLYAQNVRIAYVDTDRIMAESNSTRDAQRLFQISMENWRREIEDIESDIQRLENEYETRRMTLSESGKVEAEDRIRARMVERQQLVQRIMGEDGLAAQRNAELLAPIMEKLRAVIDRISIEENYTIVFDASSSGIIWAQERLDITQQVIIELNRAE